MVSECCVFLVLCRLATYAHGFNRVLIALSDSNTAKVADAFLSAFFKFHGLTLVWFPLIVSHNRRNRNPQTGNAPTFPNRLVNPKNPVSVLL